ncbi:MAG: ABC transporter permease [Selenomonas noxia]|jgi:ABC superfamily ATP binding cassette transporter, membrane protein|uniref:ABC transporter permease n=1 Tax=Selenomonas noxia TaxID=135083 RepID=UPI002359D199|nr:ABC transporter permease [Selenomonas noxia]
MDLVIATAAQGVLWGLYALGVYLTYRVLDIADLTVEGSFPLGAAIAASMLVSGYTPIAAILVACAAGCVSGVITGFFCTKLKIPALLAGILTMIGLYSVNLRVMGKANLPLLQQETLFTEWNIWGLDAAANVLLIGTVVVILAVLLTYWFFGTELGMAIRATGANPHMIRANGVNTDVMIVLGLLLSNGLVAICGALVAQSNGFSDVGMGTGTIVIGLASVIIGEVLFGTRSFKNWLISVVLGSIVYRAVIAIVLQLGMPPNDLKLFTAILVAIALSLPLIQSKYNTMKKGGQ